MTGPAGTDTIVVPQPQCTTPYGDFDGQQVVHIETVVPRAEFDDAGMVFQLEYFVVTFSESR